MPMTALTGTRLRERRLAAGLRQADLAERAAISPSYLNLIEHNRRNVTPEVLARLAAALGIEPQALAEASAGALLDDLRSAAAALPAAEAEVARAEDFAGRFPGWAALTAALHGRSVALERAVAALNDRLSHDPHLSAALHELLSALAGVRATAAILAETPDLAADWRDRFHRNLYQDSERLAEGAEALVAYLDRSEAAADEGVTAPQDEVELWLAARGWHLPEVEGGDPAALGPELEALASGAARVLARAHVTQAAEDAAALPQPAFAQALAEDGPDPARLAARFGCGLLAAMRRIALLPGAKAGLVTCDASGTLLFRKPADGFALPRFGAACPLWPLYAALGRPGAPVEALVAPPGPDGQVFRCLAFAETRLPLGFAGPELRLAAMLILPDPAPRGTRAVLPVGPTCRICPRGGCPARREPSILGEAAA
ncbi:helix-turn-helix transcriptional regulator [Pseudogemmobacter blasticus]|uniref:XRE family transcriptional regulator n=1 Tax=Fuscovulum blasticum DSM 2131 TaxID=1188250 RepID=A0A2T4J638_FUSBL|nr:helix-turn-helix transcriptional regulator [Fuscovulum blasticum]PTE13325.1 XRE family transcriptional regulator [Fuscovulum blasticum DSM 2131]